MTSKFLVAFFLLTATRVVAQSDTLKGNKLDEVIITANKYPQKQSATGKVITVIGRKEIEKNTGKSLSQLLNEQAGITINGAYNNPGSVQTVYIRGAASGRALILLDGIPVNDPSMINNEFDLNLFSLDNIDRIEICKGAQSTLYGSDAVAGVINIITMDPDIKKPVNFKSTLSGGSLGTFKGSGQLYGKSKKITYSVRYAKLVSNGFSSAFDSTGKSGYDRDDYNGNVLNGQLVYQVTPALSFKGFGMYSQYKANIDAGVFADEKDYTINNNNLNTGVGFTYKNDLVTVTGTYQYSELNRKYNNDSGFIATGAAVTKYERNDYYGKSQFGELYAAIRLGSQFTLLQGADFRYSSYNQHYLSINTSFPPFSSVFPDTSMSQTGMFGSLNFTSGNKKATIELGGRLNTHSRYGSNYTYTFNPSYSFAKNWRAFASVASGFKAPSLYQLSINQKLQAEKSVNYEAGIQFDNEKLNTRVVFFNRNISNGIDYNYITFKYFNYVKQLANGIELESTIRLTKAVTFAGNYTWIATQETTQNRATNKDTLTYDYALRRPAHSANASLSWSPNSRLTFSVSGKYVSVRHDIGGYQKPDVLLDDYFLVGAHAEFNLNEHVKFFADGQNVTGQKFFDIRGYNSIPAIFNGGVILNW